MPPAATTATCCWGRIANPPDCLLRRLPRHEPVVTQWVVQTVSTRLSPSITVPPTSADATICRPSGACHRQRQHPARVPGPNSATEAPVAGSHSRTTSSPPAEASSCRPCGKPSIEAQPHEPDGVPAPPVLMCLGTEPAVQSMVSLRPGTGCNPRWPQLQGSLIEPSRARLQPSGRPRLRRADLFSVNDMRSALGLLWSVALAAVFLLLGRLSAKDSGLLAFAMSTSSTWPASPDRS